MNELRSYFRVFLAVLCACSSFPANAPAAVPATINYQGLYKENGIPVTGTRTALFRLTSSDGTTEYWNSGFQPIALSTGIFRINLTIPSTINWGSIAPYLEVTVSGNVLLPRDPLTSAPFALYAFQAETLTPNGAPGVTISTSVFLPSGSLGIGTASPKGPLHVRAAGQDSLFVDPNLGYVGMGTSTPGQRLTVQNGSIQLAGAGSSLIFPDGTLMFSAGLGSAGNLQNQSDALIQSDSLSHFSGDIILKTGSSERMRVANGGNVGIGTPTPQSRLHISLTAGRDWAFNGSGTDSWIVGMPTGGNTSVINDQSINFYAAGSGGAVGGVVNNPSATLGASLSLFGNDNPSAGGAVLRAGAGSIQLNTGNAVRLSINPAGSVGIGTASPSQKLEVAGAVKATAFQGDGSALTNVSAGSLSGSPTFSTMTLTGGAFSVGGSTFVVTNGNVGVGTASPGASLHVVENDSLTDSNPPIGGLGCAYQWGYVGGVLNCSCNSGFIFRDLNANGHIDAGECFRQAFAAYGAANFGYAGSVLGVTANTLGINGVSHNPQTAAAIQLGDNYQAASRQFAIVNGSDGIAEHPGTLLFLGSSSGNRSPLSGVYTGVMSMDSSGHVGVGTASPQSRFHVFNSNPSLDATGIFQDTSGSGQGAQVYVAQDISSGKDAFFGYTDSTPAGLFLTALPNSAALMTDFGATNGLVLDTLAGPITFGTGGWNLANERMRITSSGNVGIGTTSPASKLTVLDGDIRISTSAGQPNRGIIFSDGSVQTTASGSGLWAASGSNIFNTNSGNVGIGTTNPITRFHVYRDAGAQSTELARFVSPNASAQPYITIGNPTGPQDSPYTGGYIGFNNGGAPPYLQLGVHGNNPSLTMTGTAVGFFTATPAYNVDILGQNNPAQLRLQAAGPSAMDANFIADAPTGRSTSVLLRSGGTESVQLVRQATSNDFTIATNNTERIRIMSSNGNVGVGTTNPQATLDVNGYARLAKNSAQPAACAAANDGAIALTHLYRLCVCNGGSSTWVFESDGTTACSW